jgi:hypothetical protein
MPAYSGIEINNQIKQINNMMENQITEVQNVRNNINSFIYNTELISNAYTNQKDYFNTVYIMLYNGIEQFAKEFIAANRNLQNQYINVDNDSNAYINTDNLIQEMGTLVSYTNYWLGLIDDHPYAQHYAYVNMSLKDRIQGVVDRMYQFSSSSSSNYETTNSYLMLVVNGMNSLESDCWNPETGTFSTELIDTKWIDDLNELNEKTSEKYLKDKGLSEDDILYLKSLDYTCYQVYGLLSDLPESDMEFVLKTLKSDYEGAFKIDADSISDGAYCIISDYMARLVEHNETDNLLKMVNVISMSEDVEYKDSNQRKHLTNLITSTSVTIEFGKQGLIISDELNMFQDPITSEMEAGCLKNEYLMDIYSLLMSVDYLTTSGSTYPSEHITGQGRVRANVMFGIQFKDLSYDRQSGFSYKYKNQLGFSTEGHYSIYDDAHYSISGQKNEWVKGNSDVLSDTMSQLSQEYITHLAELAKKKGDALKNFFLNASIAAVAIYNPMAGAALKALQSAAKDEVASYLKDSSKFVKDYANWDDFCKNLTPEQKKHIDNMFGGYTNGLSIIQDAMNLEKTIKALSEEEDGIRANAIKMLLGQDKIVVKDGTYVVLESIQGDGERAIIMNRWEKQGIEIFFSTEETEKLDDLKDIFDITKNNPKLKTWYESYVDEKYINDTDRYNEVINTADKIINGGIDFEYYLTEDGKKDMDIYMDAMNLVNKGYMEVHGSNTGSILSDFDTLVNDMDKK